MDGKASTWKVPSLSEKANDEASFLAAAQHVLDPLTRQEAFTLENVARAHADPIEEVARICQTHGASGWAAIFSSLTSDTKLSGSESSDGKSSFSLIPSSIQRGREGVVRWVAGRVGLWNGADRMRFGSGSKPLLAGTSKSEGFVLSARVTAWSAKLVMGQVDMTEAVYLFGGKGSRKGAGADAILGASPTLGCPGAAPGEPGFEEDFERALPRLELLIGMVFGRGGGGTLDPRVSGSPHVGLAPLESAIEASERSLWGEHALSPRELRVLACCLGSQARGGPGVFACLLPGVAGSRWTWSVCLECLPVCCLESQARGVPGVFAWSPSPVGRHDGVHAVPVPPVRRVHLSVVSDQRGEGTARGRA